MDLGKKLDNFIAIFSPEAACRRRSFREAYVGYDAATFTRKDIPVTNDERANEFDDPARDIVRSRARHLERNSDVVGGMLYALENNVVGSKINMQADSGDDKFNEEIEELFNDWQHKENCDITEQQSLTEIMRMVVDRFIIDGGIIITYVYDKKYEYGMKLQIREVSEISNMGDVALENGNVVKDGIEMTKYGKPISYHFTNYDPNTGGELPPEVVSADDVDFLWRKTRPSQYREMSRLSASITRISDLDDYSEAVAFQQKVNACNSVFIETDNVAMQPGRVVNASDGNRYTDLRGGSVRYLKAGEKAKSIITNGQAAEYENYVVTQLRMIAAHIGLSLESATRNVERVNYSSARQNMLADQQTYKHLHEFIVENLLRKMYKRFVDSCRLKGLLEDTKFDSNEKRYYKCKWLNVGLPWIDPLKEANANSVNLANGCMTFQQLCANNGVDWREQIDAMQEAQKYADEKGVNLSYIVANEAIVNKGDNENAKGQQGKQNGNQKPSS